MNNPYPSGMQLYDAAKTLSKQTITAPPTLGNNCNNYSGTNNPTTAYDSTWASMSLYTGGNYNYPKTNVYGFLCSGPHVVNNQEMSNNSAGQGWSYLSLLSTPSTQNGGFPEIYRVDMCNDPEMIWAPASMAVGTNPTMSGYLASTNAMINNCTMH